MKYLLLILLFFSISNSYACMPARIKPELKDWKVIERYKKADLVILAEFKNIKITSGLMGGIKNTFEVIDPKISNIVLHKVYKGNASSNLIIEIKTLFCGQSIDLNKKYLMYAVKHNNNYIFSYMPLPPESLGRDFKVLKEIKYKYTDPKTMTFEKYMERISKN